MYSACSSGGSPGVHRRLDDVQQPAAVVDLELSSIPSTAPERFDDPPAPVGMGEGGREDRDHRLGVGYLFQDFGLDLGGCGAVGMKDHGNLPAGKLCDAHRRLSWSWEAQPGRPDITG